MIDSHREIYFYYTSKLNYRCNRDNLKNCNYPNTNETFFLTYPKKLYYIIFLLMFHTFFQNLHRVFFGQYNKYWLLNKTQQMNFENRTFLLDYKTTESH